MDGFSRLAGPILFLGVPILAVLFAVSRLAHVGMGKTMLVGGGGVAVIGAVVYGISYRMTPASHPGVITPSGLMWVLGGFLMATGGLVAVLGALLVTARWLLSMR